MRSLLALVFVAACSDGDGTHDVVDCAATWGGGRCERGCAPGATAGVDMNGDSLDDTCRVETAMCPADRVAASGDSRGCCISEPTMSGPVIRFNECE